MMNADDNGIPSATVTVTETQEATTKNEQGRFSIKAAVSMCTKRANRPTFQLSLSKCRKDIAYKFPEGCS